MKKGKGKFKATHGICSEKSLDRVAFDLHQKRITAVSQVNASGKGLIISAF